MKPKSFVKGKVASGAQAPKNLMSKPKEAKMPDETKGSYNMGKACKSPNVGSMNGNARGRQ